MNPILFIAIITTVLAHASASGYYRSSCSSDEEQISVCRSSVQPTCANRNSIQGGQGQRGQGQGGQGQGGRGGRYRRCARKNECRCPATAPYRFLHRCYKDFECPKKEADLPSNNRTGHNFIVPGSINAKNEIYGMHISALKLPQHWYHGIALFKFKDSACANYVDMKHKAAKGPNSFLSINYRVPMKLVDLLTPGRSFMANMGFGAGPAFIYIKTCEVVVKEVLDLRRYKASQPDFPENQQYFLFGDGVNAYISHLPTKCKDFQQVLKLKNRPALVSAKMLQKGLVITFPELSGSPWTDANGKIIDPLEEEENVTTFHDEDTVIEVAERYQFDTFIINIGC